MAIHKGKAKPQDGFMDRKRQVINHVEWTKLRSQEDYCVIRRYESESLSIDVLWKGRVNTADIEPHAYWKIFRVEVSNTITTGDRPGNYVRKKVQDPVLSVNSLSEEGAMSLYIETLLKKGLLSQSENYEGEIEITEIGNKIKNQSELNVGSYLGELPATQGKESVVVAPVRSASFGSW